MAVQGVTSKDTDQHPIIDRGDKLLELTKILRNIKAEKALIEKNQLSATKSDGTPYRFLDTKLRKYLELKQQELEKAERISQAIRHS